MVPPALGGEGRRRRRPPRSSGSTARPTASRPERGAGDRRRPADSAAGSLVLEHRGDPAHRGRRLGRRAGGGPGRAARRARAAPGLAGGAQPGRQAAWPCSPWPTTGSARGGQPLFYGPGDTLAPTRGRSRCSSSGPELHVRWRPGTGWSARAAHGVEAGGWPRRVMLAWALQAPGLLRQLPAGLMVDWRLSPSERLGRLAPFVEWGDPLPRVVDGELVWLLDGYVAADAFRSAAAWPGAAAGWARSRRVSGHRGRRHRARPHIYLRPATDALGAAWAGISRGVVEPASAHSRSRAPAGAPIPVELFRVQARAAGAGASGRRVARRAAAHAPTRRIVPLTDQGLDRRYRHRLRLAAYERPTERRLTRSSGPAARGGVDGAPPRAPRLQHRRSQPRRARGAVEPVPLLRRPERLDSATTAASWSDGPVRLDVRPGGRRGLPVPLRAEAVAAPLVAWVSVAAGDRLGRGTHPARRPGAISRRLRAELAGQRAGHAGWMRRAAGCCAPIPRCGPGLDGVRTGVDASARQSLGARADTAGR